MQSDTIFMVHKPAGVVCSTVDPNLNNIVRNKSHVNYGLCREGVVARPTVYDTAREAGFPDNFGLVGRLDTETSGIILFTSNSDLLRKIRDPALSEHDYRVMYGENNDISYDSYNQTKSKQYELLLLSGKTVVSQLVINQMQFIPQEFESELSKPYTFTRYNEECHVKECKVEFIERYQDMKYSYGKPELGWCIRCNVTLHEGKHHQIRRMAHSNDYHVLHLKRIKIGGILTIDSVPNPGDCRWLTSIEYELLCRHLHVEC